MTQIWRGLEAIFIMKQQRWQPCPPTVPARLPPASRRIWTFNRPGNFDFACLIPGHYQAGMRGSITVATR